MGWHWRFCMASSKIGNFRWGQNRTPLLKTVRVITDSLCSLGRCRTDDTIVNGQPTNLTKISRYTVSSSIFSFIAIKTVRNQATAGGVVKVVVNMACDKDWSYNEIYTV